MYPPIALSRCRVAVAALLVFWAAALPAHAADPFPPPPAQAGATNKAPPMEQMVARLRERLAREPGDVQGWVLLGRSYQYLGQDAEASTAFAKARELGYTDTEGSAAPPAHAGAVDPAIMKDISATIRQGQSQPGGTATAVPAPDGSRPD
jgi:hypothetical protein